MVEFTRMLEGDGGPEGMTHYILQDLGSLNAYRVLKDVPGLAVAEVARRADA